MKSFIVALVIAVIFYCTASEESDIRLFLSILTFTAIHNELIEQIV